MRSAREEGNVGNAGGLKNLLMVNVSLTTDNATLADQGQTNTGPRYFFFVF